MDATVHGNDASNRSHRQYLCIDSPRNKFAGKIQVLGPLGPQPNCGPGPGPAILGPGRAARYIPGTHTYTRIYIHSHAHTHVRIHTHIDILTHARECIRYIVARTVPRTRYTQQLLRVPHTMAWSLSVLSPSLNCSFSACTCTSLCRLLTLPLCFTLCCV